MSRPPLLLLLLSVLEWAWPLETGELDEADGRPALSRLAFRWL